MNIEKIANDIVVGDLLLTKTNPPKKLKVTSIMVGLGERPYFTMMTEDGKTIEHDTSFDSSSATYTVES